MWPPFFFGAIPTYGVLPYAMISVSTQYVPSQIAFGFFYRVFVLIIRSLSFSDSLESSSNHSCSDTPGLTSATTNFCHNFSQLSLVVAMCMVATAHAYYNVQYGRILHSCSMKHYILPHLCIPGNRGGLMVIFPSP